MLPTSVDAGQQLRHSFVCVNHGGHFIFWTNASLLKADQPPSGLILAARITLPHFSVSSTMSLPKAVGEPISGVSPKSVRCAFSFGVARPALISALRLSTTCVGVFLGAPMPNHELTS